MENSLIASVKYYVPILILCATLSISVYLVWIDKYFNIDKQYQHYQSGLQSTRKYNLNNPSYKHPKNIPKIDTKCHPNNENYQ